MTYSINGTPLSTQPTTGDWVLLDSVDDDMNGRPIYPVPRNFALTWQFASPALFSQILALWQGVQASGTVAVSLPQYGHSSYQFYTYSGCVLECPTFDSYFEQYLGAIKMTVRNARPLLLPIS